EAVTRYDSHPAVLMYMIGNEISYNKFYTWDTGWDAIGLVNYTNGIADEIRAAGATKPISVSWGNPNTGDLAALQSLNVDIVSYQLYENLGFSTGAGMDVFTAHRMLGPAIPFFVSEYGADAISGGEGFGTLDETAQAYANGVLTNLIKDDALGQPNGVSGGCVFSWSDGWWKAGNSVTHDIGGISVLQGSGPYPDSTFHEEYWGVNDLARNPREAYFTLQSIYASY
ncbi:MAG: hypothetical protein AAGC55_23640, partial [Myxococcota bacterium]